MMKAREIKGFTIIELMITVAIIGILASIAYPSYQESVYKSRRADGKGALLGLANAMERHYTQANTYQGAGSPGTGAPSVFATQSPTGGGAAFYLLTIEVSTVNTYTLRATPTGAQVSDSCGNLELTHTGAKSPSTAGCW